MEHKRVAVTGNIDAWGGRPIMYIANNRVLSVLAGR